MVSLLRHLAVMVLVVLLPCTSDAATVVVQATPQVTYTHVSNFMYTFFGSDAHNRVSGLGARFTSSSYADAAVTLMRRTYPAASITRRGAEGSAEEVGVSGLSDLNKNAVLEIVWEVYRAYARVTDMTLNCGSESAADAVVAMVNAGFVSGFSSAKKKKFLLPAGGIIGIVFAVIVVGTVAAVGVYWKFLKSGGREVGDDTANKDDTANQDDTANKDDTANQDDTANKDDTGKKDDTANKDATANKDDTANQDDTAHKDDTANRDTCVTEVFPSPTNQPF